MSHFHRLWNVRESFRAIFQRGQVRNESGELTQHAGRVLSSLRKFCRVDKSCVQFAKDGSVDTHLTMVVEGRRECWLEIVRVLEVTDEELLKIKEHDD